MTVLSRLLAAACALVLAVVVVPAASADPTPQAPYAWGGVDTWPTNRTIGTSAYDGGVWSYTNRWGKATGANVDGKHREDYFAGLPQAQTLTYDAFGVHRSARNGDYYPPNDDARFPELSANVVFAQLHPSASGLDVRVVLNSLGEKDSSILTLALVTGSDTATSTLPLGAGLSCTGCGVERYVTVWGSGSEIATADGHPVGVVQDLDVDTVENTITFHVPDIDTSGPRLRAWLASGLHDGHGHYLAVQASQSSTAPGGGKPGATNVFDLAFVQADRSSLDERVQSDLLARGEIGPAQAVVDLAALRSGARRVEGEPGSGPVEKVLVSSSNQGDGIDSGNGPATFQNPGAGQNFHYLGRTQGYLVDLPPGYSPDHPVPEVMVLHGYNGYYDEEYFLAPQMRDAIRKLGYIGVYPLGRGDVQYEHDGELDLLEVQHAVEHDYAVDRDRVHVVGISMGGFGATKAVVRHPDVFADASVFVGGEEGNANVVNDRLASYPLTRAADPSTVGNLLDTPLLLGASTADADAAGASASALYEQLRRLGDEAHLKQYLTGTHEPPIIDFAVPQMVPLWQRAARAAVPARVAYSFDTTWDFENLRHSGSAWLQELHPALGTDGSGSAEAYTLPRAVTTLTEQTSTGGSAADRSNYLLRDSLRTATDERPVSNTLTLSLSNLDHSSVDLSQLRVDTSHRYCVDVTSDAAGRVTLSGLDFTRLELTGAPTTRDDRQITLQVPAGTTHAVLAPRGLPAAVGAPCPAAGPAAAPASDPTGGPTPGAGPSPASSPAGNATPGPGSSPGGTPVAGGTDGAAAGSGPAPATAPAGGAAGRFHPLASARILDTRTSRTPVQAGRDRQVRVSGRAGVPAAGVSAVVLNVTVALPARDGDLQVHPWGSTPRTRTSTLNWRAGRTVANAVTVGLGPDGDIGLDVGAGSAHVVVDVAGWYGDGTDGGTDVGGADFHPLTPSRVLDTRTGGGGAVSAPAPRTLAVAGRGGVPATGATAVVLGLTALGATRPADIEVYPSRSQPHARTSNTNVVRGQTVAALVTSAVSPDGTVQLSASQGSVHLVVDVLGYYSATGAGGSRYVPLEPRRVLDTRAGRALEAGADRGVVMGGRDGVPPGATAVVLNATGVGASRPLDLQVRPAGSTPSPRTSVVNLQNGAAVADASVVGLGAGGAITLSVNVGRADVLLDVVGYFIR